MKKFVIILFFFLLLFPQSGQGALKKGSLAPDFYFISADGKIHKLSQIKAKVILIEFLSIKCFACDYVIPDINRLYDTFNKRNVDIISILFNDEVDNPAKLKSFIQEKGIKYPVFISDIKLKKIYSIYGFPNFFILNEKKQIVHIYRGITKDTFALLSKDIENLFKNVE